MWETHCFSALTVEGDQEVRREYFESLAILLFASYSQLFFLEMTSWILSPIPCLWNGHWWTVLCYRCRIPVCFIPAVEAVFQGSMLNNQMGRGKVAYCPSLENSYIRLEKKSWFNLLLWIMDSWDCIVLRILGNIFFTQSHSLSHAASTNFVQ